jgi:hypothetical protein
VDFIVPVTRYAAADGFWGWFWGRVWEMIRKPKFDFAQIRWGFVSAWESSSGEACRVEQAVGERSGDFYHVPALA